MCECVQVYAARMKLSKRFEVLAMIPECYMAYGDKLVPGGPALQDHEGIEHCKKGGSFPWAVSTKGAGIKVQKCNATRVQDKHNILRIVAELDESTGEPPAEHPRYDELNASVGLAAAACGAKRVGTCRK